LSGILRNTKEHNVSESGSVSPSSNEGWETHTLLGPLEKANLSHFNKLRIRRWTNLECYTPSSEPFTIYMTSLCFATHYCTSVGALLAIGQHAASRLWSSDRTPSPHRIVGTNQYVVPKLSQKSAPFYQSVLQRNSIGLHAFKRGSGFWHPSSGLTNKCYREV
jgi:hypothetical protein